MASPYPATHFTRHHDRFFFLYGKTDDEFCMMPVGILRLEEVLYQHLKTLGYQRILFFNGKQKLYFYDLESKTLSRREKSSEPVQQSARQSAGIRRSRMCAGPLGMRKIRRPEQGTSGSVPSQDASPGNEEPLHFGRMNDLEMVGVMDCCMRDASIKTALIFTDGLDFINHTEQGAVRQMAANLKQLGSEFTSNENICIFLMPDLDAENIRMLLNRTPHGQYLLSRMFEREDQPSPQMIHVGSPRKDEVENLFTCFRLRNRLETDWHSLAETVVSAARDLCSKGGRLKELSVRVRGVNALDSNTLARISRNTDQASAMTRLKSMMGLELVAQKIEQFIMLQKETEEDGPESEQFRENNPMLIVDRLLPAVSGTGKKLNLHLTLTGNPGTGKTTVAHLIGEIFRDAGLLELGQVVSASREELVAGYVGQTALRTAEKISDAMGGVLFVDEAYRLTQGRENDFGKEAVETIMEAMSNHMGEFSVIIAGYPGRIEEFLEANPGLRRRFGPQNLIHIPDYDPPVLQHIFEQEVLQNNRRLDRALQQLIPDFFVNWHAARDPETFGNAGDVKNLFQETDARRAERITGMELERELRNTFTPEDMPERLREHLRPRKAATVEEALNMLDGLTGLAEVKAWLRRLTHLIQMKQEQHRRGIQTEPPVPGHYIFQGRPGTGKTTVARILGSILQLMGLVGRSQVHEIGPGDLIDKYVGGTEEKAQNVFKKGINGVLFIDEAHQLAEGGEHGHGRTAVKCLVPFMLNHRENLCVVAAGYPEEMERFLELDPGLSSRFDRIIRFEDFNESELLKIFSNILKKNSEISGPGLEDDIRRLFQVWVVDKGKDFGNARDVSKLAERMRERRAERLTGCDIASCSNEDMQTFLPMDIPEEQCQRMGKKVDRLEDILNSLDDLIGLSRVKQMIRTMINRLKVEKVRGHGNVPGPGHYIFVGNPGTGKTTVARKMGEMFRALGLLKKGHLVETGRSDLVAGYMGQTAIKTREVLEKSLDGVLFIDEAYQIIEGQQDSFGREALEALVAFMENHRDRLCIIAAGYPVPMQRFIGENPGLPSRFTAEIPFENYNAGEMLEIFRVMAAGEKMTLGQGVEDVLLQVFRRMEQNAGPTFGNGRDVRKMLESIMSQQANRLAEMVDNNLVDEDRGSFFRLETDDIPGMYVESSKQTKAEQPFETAFTPIPSHILPKSYSQGTTDPKTSRDAQPLVELSLLLLNVDTGDEESTGSGFIISSDGLALTCEHVVRDAVSIRGRVKTADGRESWHDCRVLKAMQGIDIALIRLEGTDFPAAVLAPYDRDPVKGEPVGVLGYPLGMQFARDANYTKGDVTSVQSDEHGDLVQCSALAYPGNSGGPVFSREEGLILGMLIGAYEVTEGMNCFRPIKYVWDNFFEQGSEQAADHE